MDVLLPLFILGILGAGGLYALSWRVPSAERAWLVRLVVIGFLLRLALATVFALYPMTRVFHEDADGYEYIGLALANYWHGTGPKLGMVAVQNTGFFYVCGALYYVFGAYRAAASYLNAFLGAATVLVLYRLTRRFFHIVVARRAAMLVCLMPSVILWNSLALKDTLVTLLVVMALSSCVSLKENFTVGAFLGLVLPVIALQPIRFYMVYFVALATIASLLFERGTKVLTGMPKVLIIGGGLLALLALVGLSSSAREGMQFLDLERINTFRQGMATTANSGFAADVDVSTPGRALLFLPVGMAVLLLGPFPWQMTSLRPLMAAPETILWWFLIPAAWRGLRFAVKERFAATSPILFFAAMLTPAYALVQGNVGAGFRQRAQLFVLLFVFTALGQYVQRCRERGLDVHLLLAPSAPPPPDDERAPSLAVRT